MNIRQLQEADYETIIEAIDDWFDGRQMSHLLPRIFFIHFRPTSFVIEEDGRVMGFLAGFVSQTYPDQAYIHFVGIEANYRGRGLGRQLYSRFFETVRRLVARRFVALLRRRTADLSRFTLEWASALNAVMGNATASLAP